MTIEEASVIIGNIPINGDGCYSISEYQQAKAMAIQSLEAWEKLRTEIMAIGNWRNESEISDNGVKDCLAIIDRHIAEIRGSE